MDQNNDNMVAKIVAWFQPEEQEPEEALIMVSKIAVFKALAALATLLSYEG